MRRLTLAAVLLAVCADPAATAIVEQPAALPRLVDYTDESLPFEMEMLDTLPPDSPARHYARGVGRLEITVSRAGTDDPYTAFCTATVVTSTLVVAPHFCGPAIVEDERLDATGLLDISLRLDFVDVDSGMGVTVPLDLEPAAEDTALGLILLRRKEGSFEADRLRIVAPQVTDGQPMWMIGHPAADPLTLRRARCDVVKQEGDALLHRCAAMGGDSGAALLDPTTGVLLGIHSQQRRDLGTRWRAGISGPAIRDAFPQVTGR